MLLSELGQRIRAQRERLGLKQQDIANALQVSPQAVSKWERGENGPDIATLAPLAKLLGVSTDWILDTHNEGQDVFEATVLVSGVAGTYEKSLRMVPNDFALWANGFLSQITEAALRFDGVPIKYMADQFLCFFSGQNHQQRAARAATVAKRLVSEQLEIVLSTGEIYLGSIGHPEYANPDIMGKVVNIAFLMSREDIQTQSGILATHEVVEKLNEQFETLQTLERKFYGIEHPVQICEIRETE
ncbi:MAG: transcriptional regulator with XRE-family HTH domain [Candidatus Latescibacterota bacterium]|mgnify:CR=1 FL=1|jgi:transcriptional regulator with XRE-family HTH domain